jgi:hypothetical protein
MPNSNLADRSILIIFTPMKTYLIIAFSALIMSCNYGKKDDRNNNCSDYQSLSGTYQHSVNEGKVIWSGELTGTVDFSGVDFNDMTCSYEVTDCETGAIVMNCNGANFNTTIELLENNSIMLNSSLYKKL